MTTSLPVGQRPGDLFRGPKLTLWAADGIRAAWRMADDYIEELQPPAVEMHTWETGAVSKDIRAKVPGVVLTVGYGIDGIARKVAQKTWSVARGVDEFRKLGAAADREGCIAVKWNAEASWKRPPNSDEAKRLFDVIRGGTLRVAEDFPGLAQWHTAYDHPHYHSSYPWRAWLGEGSPITVSWPQVYAAPEGGLRAHRGALEARESRALASWKVAVTKGWIRPDVPDGTPGDETDVDWRKYLQCHHANTADTVAESVDTPAVAFWACPTRMDAEGRTAVAAVVALHRLGYRGPDAVREAQSDLNVPVDGRVGLVTTKALLARLGVNADVLLLG